MTDLMLHYPKVKVKLTGEDGNIFFIISRVRQALRKAKVPETEIEEFSKAVMSTHSYDEALQTVMRWVSVR